MDTHGHQTASTTTTTTITTTTTRLRQVCATFVSLCCTMMADPSGRPLSSGVARRRRQRRLRSMLRHERMTVAMALAEKLHHSTLQCCRLWRNWQKSPRFSPRTEFICIFFISSWYSWFCRWAWGRVFFALFPKLKSVRSWVRTRGRNCSPSRAHPPRQHMWTRSRVWPSSSSSLTMLGIWNAGTHPMRRESRRTSRGFTASSPRRGIFFNNLRRGLKRWKWYWVLWLVMSL